MNAKTIIELKNISKTYKLKSSKDDFLVLKNINLKINNGDRIGIIGPNGSGKTTLLKIISGITKQSSGEVIVKGKIVLIMNLEDGFKSALSGRENILLNGLLVGMTKKEVDKKMDEIIEYSGIKSYINEPFYTYSSGMKFRLAFSVAIASECEVLIIDEVLLSGDFNFQQKVFESLKKLTQEKKNIVTILCSHLPDVLWSFSNKYLSLENNSIKQLSKEEFSKMMRQKSAEWRKVLNLPLPYKI